MKTYVSLGIGDLFFLDSILTKEEKERIAPKRIFMSKFFIAQSPQQEQAVQAYLQFLIY